MLEFSSVSKIFASKEAGGVVAVSDVSFNVKKGEACFLLGGSGCGKTTILRIIAGLEEPTKGKVSLNKVDITHTPPERRKIGFVFQQYALWPHLSVQEHVAFGLRVIKTPQNIITKRVHELLILTGLDKLAMRKPHELSGGQQQRVALARALAPEPEILLLDEPFSNLDSALKYELTGELQRLQKQLGLTFIFVTHDRSEALSLADSIVLLDKGAITAQGKPSDLFFTAPNLFTYSFLGETVYLPSGVAEAKTVTRPHFFSLQAPTAAHITFAGNVTQLTFLGVLTRVQVSLIEFPGAVINAVVPTHEIQPHSIGNKINLFIRETDILAF